MYWLRWHYHVKDIAGAPYRVKRTQLLCFLVERSPLAAAVTCGFLVVRPESLLTLSDDPWWRCWWWRPNLLLPELDEPAGDRLRPLSTILLALLCWRSELIVARSSFSSTSCSATWRPPGGLWLWGISFKQASHWHDKGFTPLHAIWRANEGRTRDSVRGHAVRWSSACHVVANWQIDQIVSFWCHAFREQFVTYAWQTAWHGTTWCKLCVTFCLDRLRATKMARLGTP